MRENRRVGDLRVRGGGSVRAVEIERARSRIPKDADSKRENDTTLPNILQSKKSQARRRELTKRAGAGYQESSEREDCWKGRKRASPLKLRHLRMTASSDDI